MPYTQADYDRMLSGMHNQTLFKLLKVYNKHGRTRFEELLRSLSNLPDRETPLPGWTPPKPGGSFLDEYTGRLSSGLQTQAIGRKLAADKLTGQIPQKVGATFAEGLYQGAGHLNALFDNASKLLARDISRLTGIKEEKLYGGIFGKLASNAEYWAERLNKDGLKNGLVADVIRGLGATGPDLPFIMAGGPAGLPAWMGLKGAMAEGTPGATLKGATEGATLHGVLKLGGLLPSKLKYPAVGGYAYATTPGDRQEKLTSALQMAILSYSKHGKKTVGQFLSEHPKLWNVVDDALLKPVVKAEFPDATPVAIRQAGGYAKFYANKYFEKLNEASSGVPGGLSIKRLKPWELEKQAFEDASQGKGQSTIARLLPARTDGTKVTIGSTHGIIGNKEYDPDLTGFAFVMSNKMLGKEGPSTGMQGRDAYFISMRDLEATHGDYYEAFKNRYGQGATPPRAEFDKGGRSLVQEYYRHGWGLLDGKFVPKEPGTEKTAVLEKPAFTKAEQPEKVNKPETPQLVPNKAKQEKLIALRSKLQRMIYERDQIMEDLAAGRIKPIRGHDPNDEVAALNRGIANAQALLKRAIEEPDTIAPPLRTVVPGVGVDYFVYDSRTKKFRKLDATSARDYKVQPHEIKVLRDRHSRELTQLDTGFEVQEKQLGLPRDAAVRAEVLLGLRDKPEGNRYGLLPKYAPPEFRLILDITGGRGIKVPLSKDPKTKKWRTAEDYRSIPRYLLNNKDGMAIDELLMSEDLPTNLRDETALMDFFGTDWREVRRRESDAEKAYYEDQLDRANQAKEAEAAKKQAEAEAKALEGAARADEAERLAREAEQESYQKGQEMHERAKALLNEDSKTLSEEVVFKDPETGMPDLNKLGPNSLVAQLGDQAGGAGMPKSWLQEVFGYIGDPKWLYWKLKPQGRYLSKYFYEQSARMFRLYMPPIYKRVLYDTLVDGRDMEGRLFKKFDAELKQLKAGVKADAKSEQRIAVYAYAQQEGGIKALKEAGIRVIPQLTPPEMAAYTRMREVFDDLFLRINKSRELLGLKPMPKIKNYFTFMRDAAQIENWIHDAMFVEDVAPLFAQLNEPRFEFIKHRDTEAKIPLDYRAFDIFEYYVKRAIRYEAVAPTVANWKLLSRPLEYTVDGRKQVFDLKQYDRNLFNYLEEWVNFATEKITAGQISTYNATTKHMISRLNKNVAMAVLAFNVRSMLIQPTSLRNIYVAVGERHFINGLGQMVQDLSGLFHGDTKLSNFWKAMEQSRVLQNRMMDLHVQLADAPLKAPSKTAKTQTKIRYAADYAKRYGRKGLDVAGEFGMKGLELFDLATATLSWAAAYSKATTPVSKGGMGLAGREAIVYADDLVTATQASGAMHDLAPIQRSQFGKTITLFQTFVLNEWNWLWGEGFGTNGLVRMTKTERMANIARLVVATGFVNAMCEKIFKIRSPFPVMEPYILAFFKGELPFKKLVEFAGREAMEQLPIAGGLIRYSTPYKKFYPAGIQVYTDAVQVIEKALSDFDKPWRKFKPEDFAALGKFLGAPGTGQIEKTVRRRAKGANWPESVIGIRSDLAGKTRTRRMTKEMQERLDAMRREFESIR